MAASFIAWAVLAVLVPATVLAAKPAAAGLADGLAEKEPYLAGDTSHRSPARAAMTEKFITEVLRPMGFNVLILEVDYGFEFKSRPELQCHGISKEQARKLSGCAVRTASG